MSTPEIQPNPPVPPVPAYGEYAAPGPVYAPVPPAQQQYPQPGYYVPQPYTTQQPTYQYYGEPGKRPLRVADLVISIILLVIGLFGVGYTLLTGVVLESAMQQQYDSYDLGTYTPGSSVAVLQAVLIVSHVVLYVVVVPITLLLIVKRRISFWVPLTGGVIAAAIFWVALIVFIASDPTLRDALSA